MNPLNLLRGADLPPLGWQHVVTLDLTRVEPVRNRDYFPKPWGGLWTSSLVFDEQGVCLGTDWTSWCLDAQFSVPQAPITLVVPDPDARVCRVNTVADLVALESAYRHQQELDLGTFAEIDWESLAKDVDAVWLTDVGQWATRFSQPSLYGWDCETVLWLNPRVTVGETVKVTNPLEDSSCLEA